MTDPAQYDGEDGRGQGRPLIVLVAAAYSACHQSLAVRGRAGGSSQDGRPPSYSGHRKAVAEGEYSAVRPPVGQLTGRRLRVIPGCAVFAPQLPECL